VIDYINLTPAAFRNVEIHCVKLPSHMGGGATNRDGKEGPTMFVQDSGDD